MRYIIILIMLILTSFIAYSDCIQYNGTMIGDINITDTIIFDGINDRVDLHQFNFTDNTSTICARFSPDGLDRNQNILSQYGATASTRGQMLYMVSASLRYYIRNGVYIGNTLSDTGYVYYCGVMDGDTATQYLNGINLSSISVPTGLAMSPDIFAIGSSPTGAGLFKGNIKAIEIYDRALSTSEILENHDRGLYPLDDENLIALYSYEYHDGTTLIDKSCSYCEPEPINSTWGDYEGYDTDNYVRYRTEYNNNDCLPRFVNITHSEILAHQTTHLYCIGIENITILNKANHTMNITCYSNFSDFQIKSYVSSGLYQNNSINEVNHSLSILYNYDLKKSRNHIYTHTICNDEDVCTIYMQNIRVYVPPIYDNSRFLEGTCPLDESQSYILGLFLIFGLMIIGLYFNMTKIKIPFFSALVGLVFIVMSIPFYACSTYTGIAVSSIGLLFILWEMIEWLK